MEEVGQDEATNANSDREYEARENLWDEAWPGDSPAQGVHPGDKTDNQNEQLGFPDVVGTSDAMRSVRDGEPYMPPTDPPVLPGGREAIHSATGFGTSPDEETERQAPFRNDSDIEDEALLLLQEDSLTSRYTLVPKVIEGVVTIRGTVADVDDAEHALAVVGKIRSVVDVVDEMTIDPNVRA